MVNKCGQTVRNMKVSGDKTRPMEMVNQCMRMETCTRASGRMTKLTDMEATNTQMGLPMLETGKTTNSMAKEQKLGLMVRNMKDSTLKAKNMEKEH